MIVVCIVIWTTYRFVIIYLTDLWYRQLEEDRQRPSIWKKGYTNFIEEQYKVSHRRLCDSISHIRELTLADDVENAVTSWWEDIFPVGGWQAKHVRDDLSSIFFAG